MRRAAVVFAGLALLASACGSSKRADAAQTTVRYGIYPGGTATVVTTDPQSSSCHGDADAFSRGSVKFLTHYGALAASPADPYYMLLRQQLADFQARHCDPQLLGMALQKHLSPSERRALLAHASRPMETALREALAAANA